VAALLGVGAALVDHFPHDLLHPVYGVLAVSVIPGAAFIAGGRTGQRQGVVWAIAGIVLVILVFRLFQTGG
jgi:hypothetical protein